MFLQLTDRRPSPIQGNPIYSLICMPSARSPLPPHVNNSVQTRSVKMNSINAFHTPSPQIHLLFCKTPLLCVISMMCWGWEFVIDSCEYKLKGRHVVCLWAGHTNQSLTSSAEAWSFFFDLLERRVNNPRKEAPAFTNKRLSFFSILYIELDEDIFSNPELILSK